MSKKHSNRAGRNKLILLTIGMVFLGLAPQQGLAQSITQIIDSTGDGTHTFISPFGAAVDGAGNVYVTGGASDNVFKIAPDGTITQIIDANGDGTNQFHQPFGVAVDSGGNVYVAGDVSDNAFRIEPDGTITKIIDHLGDGTNLFDAPIGVAVDGAGNVFITAQRTHNAFRIEPDGTITQIIDSTGDGTNPINTPNGIAVDAAGNVYVTGRESDNAFKIEPDGTITEIIDSTGDGTNPLDHPFAITVDELGNVYVPGTVSDNVFKIIPGGTISQIIDASGDGTNPLAAAIGVAVDGPGNVYVAASNSNNAFKITPGGTITEIIDSSGDGTAANGLEGTFGIAVDELGNVLVTGRVSHNAFKIGPGAVCGNGVVESGEECDDANTTDGDCCSATCQDEAAGSQTCGVGACEVTTAACAAGAPVVCTPGTPAADDDTCDGGDDDCDGIVDEDFVSTSTTCGVGACASTGSTSCVGGEVQDSCIPGLASDEVCDGLDNDCDGLTDEGFIEIHAATHTVGSGSHPGSTKNPLVGILVCAYDKSDGSCSRDECGGISHQHYECIAAGDGVDGPCAPTSCCTTDANGECTINAPPGDYIVISADATKTVLPDPLGVSASNLLCGETKKKHLQQIVRADGSKKPAKTTRLTGSELLIIEPEFILWDGTVQLYPFVFESVGDWGVTGTVTPPEGFLADYASLSENVDNELKAMQFTITEIGSDLVPTETTFQVSHNGHSRTVRSDVGILLTPEYAQSRGFNVAVLRARGLIKERPGNQRNGRGQGQGNP